MSRIGFLALALLVACGGNGDDDENDDAGVSCGDSLTCGDGEFCLSFQAADAATGEEEYSCEPLPDGCDSFDHMCFDDPDVCIDDWATAVCGENTFSSGCVAIGSAQEAFCQEGSYSSR